MDKGESEKSWAKCSIESGHGSIISSMANVEDEAMTELFSDFKYADGD